MSNRKRAVYLVFVIAVLIGILSYVLDRVGIIKVGDYIPQLAGENKPIENDQAYPTEVDKLDNLKLEQKLLEEEEKLAQKEQTLTEAEAKLKQGEQNLEEQKKSLLAEKEKLHRKITEWNDRKKNVKDLANKVENMQPEKAKEMMDGWNDFDIIDVLRQIDANALEEGKVSISSYLLTLFDKKRRSELTRKMLLPPLEIESIPGVDEES